MNLIDIILLSPVAYGLYAGYNKGLIKQLTSVIAIIAALLFSFKLSNVVSTYLLEKNLVQEDWSNLIGFILTFFGILIVVRLSGRLIKGTAKTLGLGFIEQLLGGIFGAIKVFLIMLVLLYFFLRLNTYLDIVPEATFTQSLIYPYYEAGFDYVTLFWEREDVDLK